MAERAQKRGEELKAEREYRSQESGVILLTKRFSGEGCKSEKSREGSRLATPYALLALPQNSARCGVFNAVFFILNYAFKLRSVNLASGLEALLARLDEGFPTWKTDA